MMLFSFFPTFPPSPPSNPCSALQQRGARCVGGVWRTKQDFTEQVLARERTLYRVARAMLRQEADQQDAVQETVAKAWAKRGSLRDERYFATWLTRILINECASIARRHRRIVLMHDWQEDALTASAAFDEPSGVEEALDALPEKLRLPTVLHYMEGFSLAEIGEMLHLPLGTVKARLHDARIALKLELTPNEEA